jgi:phosphoglycerate dehydrogenase-like enzyme
VKPAVWIPDSTESRFREPLEAVAGVHDFPTSPAAEGPLGRGDMLVVAHSVRAAFAAIPQIDGLRVVQAFFAGVDALIERIPDGITLCDASGVHDASVAEWIVMAILASNRNLAPQLAAQRDAHWRRERDHGDDLEGATVLVIGYGSIGRATEARLSPFGVEVRRVARQPRPGVEGMDALPRLLPEADIVVILLPSTPATQRIIGRDVLAAMKPGSLLVNASRGSVLDTDALLLAVSSGRIRAALDVTDPEPLPDGHPLWSAPGVLITPHIAGDVRREEERAWALVRDQVERLARGQPLRNVVADGY